MTTLAEVKSGTCTLVDLVRINDYLEMQRDIQEANTPKPRGGRRR